jgi:hypothetical protein
VVRFAGPRGGGPDALAAYGLATGDTGKRTAAARWIDYYGPRARSEVDPSYGSKLLRFKDKIVFVGKSMDAEAGLLAKDSFLTPFRGKHGSTTFGVEIHAVLTANFLEGREVKLLDRWIEVAFLLLLPLVASLTFLALRPLAGGAAFLLLLVLPWAIPTSPGALRPVGPAVIRPRFRCRRPTASLIWYYLTTVRDRENQARLRPLPLARDDPEDRGRLMRSTWAARSWSEPRYSPTSKGFTTIARA